jgi:hypothetical protein
VNALDVLSGRRRVDDMDAQRLKDTYQRIRSLKIRPRPGGGLVRPSPDQLEQGLRDLAAYTVELKGIVEDLILAIAGRPKGPGE